MARKRYNAEAIIHKPREAQVRIEPWRVQDNTVTPHSVLGYRPPGPEALYSEEPTNIQKSASTNSQPGPVYAGRSILTTD